MVSTAGTAILLDHPLGETGLRTTDGMAFSTMDDGSATYVSHATYTHTHGNETVTRTTTIFRHANGTYVRKTNVSATNRSLAFTNATLEAVVILDGAGYRLREYGPDASPETVIPHFLHRGNRTYERVDPDSVDGVPFPLLGLHTFVYTRAGTVTRGGETLTKYAVIGERGGAPPLFEDTYSGYILVDDADTIRYANVTAAADDDDSQFAFRYESHPGRTLAIPDWLSLAETIPPESATDVLNDSAELQNRQTDAHDRRTDAHDWPNARDRPSVRAYSTKGGVVLTTNGSWTPPEGATATVVYEDGETRTVDLNASRSLFHHYRNGTYRIFLAPTDGTLAVSRDPRFDAANRSKRPRRVVVDWEGLNYYDLRVRSSASVASFGNFEAAHLRPSNGGGRTVRVGNSDVSWSVPWSAPLTFIVGNRTSSRSVTKPVRTAFLNDSFYVVRTADGLAVVNETHPAPLSLPFDGTVADRRFVANATLTITVEGVPVVYRRLPDRVTQSNETPVSELLTGVSIATFDSPDAVPEPSLVDSVVLPTNWTEHTLVRVHNWNYHQISVSGGVDDESTQCPPDHTCFYRVPDGERIRVETGNGTVLYEGRVNGNATIAPW